MTFNTNKAEHHVYLENTNGTHTMPMFILTPFSKVIK